MPRLGEPVPQVHRTGDQNDEQQPSDHDQQQKVKHGFGPWRRRRDGLIVSAPEQGQYVFGGIEPGHGVFSLARSPRPASTPPRIFEQSNRDGRSSLRTQSVSDQTVMMTVERLDLRTCLSV